MPEVGDIVTVILWSGQYRNDAVAILPDLHGPFRTDLEDLRVEGSPGCWFVVADAVRYQP